MSFLKKLGGGLQKIGGAVSAVPGLGAIGAIGSIGGSLLQGRAPNIGQLAGVVPGLGTVGAVAGIAGSLGGRGGAQRGGTNMNVMPGGMPQFQPPAFNFTQPPTNGGGSGSMGGLPAIIPSATALQRFLSWAAAIALGQTAADAVAQLVQSGTPWQQWSQGARNVWNQFSNSQSTGFDASDFNSCMMPIVVDPTYEMRATAPRGYVIVEHNGQKVAMEKGRARQCGKWKPAKKPPITAAEYRQLQTAVRVEKKIKGLATKAGQVCRPRKTGR